MKKTALLFASLLSYSSLVQGDQPGSMQEKGECVSTQNGIDAGSVCHPAYNAPANITLWSEGNKKDMHAFVSASFIYYYASEGGLDLANSSMLVENAPATAYITAATSNSKALFQDFAYKPGFTVAAGATLWDWELTGQYTWIRQTTTTSKHAPTPVPNDGEAVWILNNWFQQLSPEGQTISATNVSSKWHLAMDLADLTASRPFYQGRKLAIAPFFGLRAAWIRQNVRVGIEVPTLVISTQSAPVIYSRNSSNSWALGPRVGFNTSWLLGMGFRVEGGAAGSLLFTQYTSIKHREKVADSTISPSTIKTSFSNLNVIRPEADLSLGLGWGSYFNKQRFHFDLSADYDFMIFFEQNMIRKLLDQTISGVGASVSNLYLHGLNIKARFDF